MLPLPKLDAARLILGLCVGLGGPSSAFAGDADRATTLAAIHSLENPRDLARPGPAGELGAYQFREVTWRAYTAEPFARARDRARSDFVAERHYDWLKQRLEAAHLPASPYNIALAWNGGVAAAIRGQAPRRAHDYAERAANLADLYRRTAVVADTR